MNGFGRIFRISIWGESHGPAVGCTVDGMRPGIALDPVDFRKDLDRRRGGQQAGTTPRAEADLPQLLSGVFNGKTTGTPLTIMFTNTDTNSKDYTQFREMPRPGHADFVASKKFRGFDDFRGGGHFSGRLTAPLVAAGVLAKKQIFQLLPTVSINADVVEVGGMGVEEGIREAIRLNDSIGAIVECRVKGLPVGLGEPFFDSVESLISHAVFSIPAIKGIEFGSGFRAALMQGSLHNDAFADDNGVTITNNAGGISGGITNGNEIFFRVAVKPASSTPQPQKTYNFKTGAEEILEVKGRHDLVIALRVPPVLEAVTAIVLADLALIEFRQHEK